MTRFDELQQAHQHLLDRMDEVTDKAAFAREVQAFVSRVCDEAVDVPAPRDRDQLRANLRFWASYIYDATGTYPNTTLRPPRMEGVAQAPSIPSAPQPKPTASALRPVADWTGYHCSVGSCLHRRGHPPGSPGCKSGTVSPNCHACPNQAAGNQLSKPSVPAQ